MYRKIIHRRYQGRRFSLLIALAVLLLGMSWYFRRFAYDFFSRSSNYDKLIKEAADRHCIDSCLLKAVIWRESRFDPSSLGNDGEIGLMQVMREWAVTEWAKEFGAKLPVEGVIFSPRLNIEIGSWYLARSMRKWRKYKHREELALAEYNAGNIVKKWVPSETDGDVVDRISYPSTRSYVISIMDKYGEYSIRREAE
jgi:soluble lytic murein transglycosylase